MASMWNSALTSRVQECTLSFLFCAYRSYWHSQLVPWRRSPWNWEAMLPLLSLTVQTWRRQWLVPWHRSTDVLDRYLQLKYGGSFDTPYVCSMTTVWWTDYTAGELLNYNTLLSLLQTCVCANRMLVQEGIHDKFVEGLVKASNALKVGDGFDEGTTQGPLINARGVKKVQASICITDDIFGKSLRTLCYGAPLRKNWNDVYATAWPWPWMPSPELVRPLDHKVISTLDK